MEEIKKEHKIIIENREKVIITGVEDVESFDDGEIIMYTADGVLNLVGDSFKINKLSVETGEAEVEGYLSEVKYSGNDKSGGGFWSKIFR